MLAMVAVDVAAIGVTIEMEGCPPIKLEVLDNCDGFDIAMEMLLSGIVCGQSDTGGGVGGSDSEGILPPVLTARQK